MGRLYLSPGEIEILCTKYADELDPSRINWKLFEVDIEEGIEEPSPIANGRFLIFILVVEIRSLDKRPYKIVQLPQQEILDLPKEGLESWNDQDPDIRNFWEETIFRIKSKIVKRQLYLEPCFKDMDT